MGIWRICDNKTFLVILVKARKKKKNITGKWIEIIKMVSWSLNIWVITLNFNRRNVPLKNTDCCNGFFKKKSQAYDC